MDFWNDPNNSHSIKSREKDKHKLPKKKPPKNDITQAVVEIGMARVLQALINSIPVNSNEGYLLRLRKDLIKTLKNYKDRYNQ